MSSAALALPNTFQAVPQTRISGKVREAVRLMVEQGLNRAEAAQTAGMTDHGLYSALRLPHVLAYRRELMEVLRTSEASRSMAHIGKLADKADSEHVRLQANIWRAGIDGISPIAKSESVNVHAHLTPGITIVRTGFQAHDEAAQVIDGQARQVQEPMQINRIGQSVPHPSMRNALQIEAKRPGNQASAVAEGGGQKCATDD